MSSLIDSEELAKLRLIADAARNCIHCGEPWNHHAQFGDYCPIRDDHGLTGYSKMDTFE